MLDMAEIKDEIERLEQMETNYQNCSKLAILYAIYDRYQKPEKITNNSSYAASEFLKVVAAAPLDQVLEIIDEHMDCIKVLYPKEYYAIIKRIQDIH